MVQASLHLGYIVCSTILENTAHHEGVHEPKPVNNKPLTIKKKERERDEATDDVTAGFYRL